MKTSISNQIFKHFKSNELIGRGLNYKTAVTETANVFSVRPEEVEEIILNNAKKINLSGQEMDWTDFPQSIIDAAINAETENPAETSASEAIIKAARAARAAKLTESAIAEEARWIEQEKELAIEAERTREMFTNQFGIDPKGIIKGGRGVYLGNNITLRREVNSHTFSGMINWHVNKECANREEDDYEHAQIYYANIYDLAGLGDFLEYTSSLHLCRACQNQVESNSTPAPAPTVEQRLVSILREFINENTYEGGNQ